MMWELTTSQSFLMSSLMYLGEIAEVVRRLPLMVAEGLERGNLLLATEARTRVNFGWLATDQVGRAQYELDQALLTWSHQGFHRQHYNALISQANIELYKGDPGLAWQLVEEKWAPLRKSLLLRVQVLRAESHFLRARCALAAAATGSADQKHLLRIAKRHAAKIARERMAWIDPFAPLIRGAVSAIRGDTESARRDVATAAEGFDKADMRLYAAAAWRRLGQITGADKGAQLVQQAERFMRDQGIPRPDRVTAIMAPGYAVDQ
jgi:hypothetical protein